MAYEKPEPTRATRNPAAEARFLAGLDAMRRGALEAARALLEIDRSAHFIFQGCASVAEYGELHGASATETRHLVGLGRAVDICPELGARVLDGRIALHSASLLDAILSNPSMLRKGDEWLAWAETETTKDLRRRIDRRREEVLEGGAPVVAMTVFVSEKGRDEFARARAIASRKAERTLTQGETLEAVVDHYLQSFDLARRGEGSRRLPHTSTVLGRHVPNAVRRELMARDGDRCALPFCDNEIFLENAHVVAHAAGGHREADNLLRLCSKHHRMLDEGRLRVMGPADAPTFADAEGRPVLRRGSARPGAEGHDPPAETDVPRTGTGP